MLSINIPVYNVDVSNLVGQVTEQALLAGIDYEIRVYDDCSNREIKKKNRQLAELNKVVYLEMPKNMGRAAIRNKMGFESIGDYLLFIDADSKIESESFIKTYLHHALPDRILCGGTTYENHKPDDANKQLRWVYGVAREAISATKRNSNKGFIITSNNFLIDRQLFRKIHFRENIGPYGHEDTLLGYDLYKNGIIPLHLQNPVVHIGLEDSETFLVKTRNALENLKFITEEIVGNAPDFIERVKFLKQYNRLSRLVPLFLIHFLYLQSRKSIEKNLKGCNPNLLLFDFYKVGYYSTLRLKEQKAR